jgi:hypothetical protein
MSPLDTGAGGVTFDFLNGHIRVKPPNVGATPGPGLTPTRNFLAILWRCPALDAPVASLAQFFVN